MADATFTKLVKVIQNMQHVRHAHTAVHCQTN